MRAVGRMYERGGDCEGYGTWVCECLIDWQIIS